MYFRDGERWLFYKDKLKEVDGQIVAGEPLTTLWDDILSNNLHNEGGVSFPKGKKPEGLVKRVLDLATNPGDLVLDSFLGSGTTPAVAHKMGRRWIGIELGEHAVTHCVPRLKKVVDGEQGGISGWKGGGGFRFCRLGPPIFDENDHINAGIRFPVLAAHVWFSETHMPLVKAGKSALLGVHNNTAYYLLYNGILGDKRPGGGNVLTGKVLGSLARHDGPKVIYGECTSLGEERLRREGVVFKQIPYDVKRR
jgi:adenine-specific DNA-methyltransferase